MTNRPGLIDERVAKMSAPLIFKVACEPWEFEQVHRLNYKTFVEEIPQHEANPDELLVDNFHQENMHEDALLEAKRYFEALADHAVTDALTRGFAEGGYAESMCRAAEKLAERFDQSYVPPIRIARLYAYADEANAALQWLEKAYEERDFDMVYLDVHPDWENLRSDPRFQALVRRMNFRGSSA